MICINNHGNYMHTQNSQVENTPSVIINLGDSRILKWRRHILTRLPDGKTKYQTDKQWQTSFHMNNHPVTISNPLDECPTYNNVLDTKVKYQHGGVNIIYNKLSVGYFFRVVKTVKEYNMRNDIMISIREPKKNGVNLKVTEIFDRDLFHQNLINSYKDKIA